MEDQFVPLDIAMELEKLGFDNPCLAYYDKGKFTLTGLPANYNYPSQYKLIQEIISAPLYQQVFEWFDEEYLIKVSQFHHFTTNEYLGGEYYLHSYMFLPIHVGTFMDDREAQIACINKMIEVVKKISKF